MVVFRNIVGLCLLFLFAGFSSSFGSEFCDWEEDFNKTRIRKSDLIFYGQKISRKKYWRDFCGKRTIQECPNYQYKTKVKVLEAYKGSPPPFFVEYISPKEHWWSGLEKPGSVRLVLVAIEIDMFDVFFRTPSSDDFKYKTCFSIYDYLSRAYMFSYFKTPSFEEASRLLRESLVREGTLIEEKESRKKSRAPNPFSKKPKPPPPPIPPKITISEQVSLLVDEILELVKYNSLGRQTGKDMIKPLGELFSLWVSVYPEFEKEMLSQFEKTRYQPGDKLPEEKTPQRDLLRLLAMGLSGSKNSEIKRKILPILFEDIEATHSQNSGFRFPPDWSVVATYHLAITGLPEAKEFLEPLVLKENPKQQLALWALNLFNRNMEAQRELAK